MSNSFSNFIPLLTDKFYKNSILYYVILHYAIYFSVVEFAFYNKKCDMSHTDDSNNVDTDRGVGLRALYQHLYRLIVNFNDVFHRILNYNDQNVSNAK